MISGFLGESMLFRKNFKCVQRSCVDGGDLQQIENFWMPHWNLCQRYSRNESSKNGFKIWKYCEPQTDQKDSGIRNYRPPKAESTVLLLKQEGQEMKDCFTSQLRRSTQLSASYVPAEDNSAGGWLQRCLIAFLKTCKKVLFAEVFFRAIQTTCK